VLQLAVVRLTAGLGQLWTGSNDTVNNEYTLDVSTEHTPFNYMACVKHEFVVELLAGVTQGMFLISVPLLMQIPVPTYLLYIRGQRRC
jgi:hypothetical protein